MNKRRMRSGCARGVTCRGYFSKQRNNELIAVEGRWCLEENNGGRFERQPSAVERSGIGWPLADNSGTMQKTCDHVNFRIKWWMKRGGGGACLDNPWKLLAYAARKVAKDAFDWRSSGAGMWFPGWPVGEKVRRAIEVIRNVHNLTDRFQRRLLIKTPICLRYVFLPVFLA